MSLKKEFAKDTVIFGLGNGIKKFIGLFLLPFYTRALSPSDFGILDSLGTFAMFFSAFINMGLDSATGFYFFQAKDELQKGKLLFTHLILKLIAFVPPLILSLFSAQISLILFKSTDYTWVVFISIITIPINLLMSEQSRLYRYFRKPWQYNLITIVKSLTNITIGINLVVILKWGIMGAQLASIISSLVVVLGSFIFYTRKIYTYAFDWGWAKKMLRFGFPILWAGLAVWVFNSSDRFFLLHYSNIEQIGFYSIGSTFSQPILLINMAVQMSFGVLFYKIFYQEEDINKSESKKMAIEAFNLYLIVSICIATVVSVFGKELIGFVATKEYIPGALAVPFLMFSAIAAQGYQTMGPGIELSEKTWHFTWITGVTALVNIILNFVFIPQWGYIGAAGSTLISFILYWLIKVKVANRFFAIPYPYARIGLIFTIGLLISLFFNFIELSYSISLVVAMKIFSLLLLLFLFWLMGFIPKNVFLFFKVRL